VQLLLGFSVAVFEAYLPMKKLRASFIRRNTLHSNPEIPAAIKTLILSKGYLQPGTAPAGTLVT